MKAKVLHAAAAPARRGNLPAGSVWMWIAGGRNRAVARSAFAEMLPRQVLERRSKGSFMGYSGAVYRRNKNAMRNFLLDGQLQAHGLLDTDALRRAFDGDVAPRDRSLTRIFDLCMVENRVRHQRDGPA
uniref:asparagine synthase-related protein n=1 Tax=Fulvimonas soli TaxID=155197 RepID=UPI002482570D|nr:asparagine synthase-related protein [Fulvimonas soli]